MVESFVMALSISLVQVGFVGVGEDADRAWHECDLDLDLDLDRQGVWRWIDARLGQEGLISPRFCCALQWVQQATTYF